MSKAKTLIATAVVAACGAWPLASLAQAGGGAGSGSGSGGNEGGTTRYDAPPPAQRPSDSSPNPGPGGAAGAAEAMGSSGSTGSSASGTTTYGSGATGSGMSGTGTMGPSSRSGHDGTMGMGSTAGMSDADWERGRASSYSLLPWTSYGYVGLNLGRANWSDSCEGFSGIFNCDNTAFAGKVYTGGLISRMVGFEIGYVNFGRPDTSYGSWKAHGLNASIVANLPVDPVNIFARFGTTYGWTSTPAGAGLYSGDDNGFGIAYGAGIGFDVTPQFMITAEWDRNRFRFVNGDQDLDLYSVGLRYKF